MDMETAADTFAVLGHAGRLAVFRLLMRHAPRGVRAGEIAGALGLKQNTASVYLKALERAGLIAPRREGRAIFYAIDLPQTAGLIDYFLADCCRGRPDLCAPAAVPDPARRVFQVLFLCSGNSARSLMAEAILTTLGEGRFAARSAGTQPRAAADPQALDLLRRHGHDLAGLRPKGVETFRGPAAPRFDFVFTVCDRAAHEDCAAWPGQPMTAHWGLPDPAAVSGAPALRALTYAATYAELHRRIAAFVALPLAGLERVALQARLDALGAA